MSINYLGLPLRFKKILRGQLLDQVSLRESIEQHIKLILTTKFGENRFNPAYGCEVWEYDFQRIASFNTWRDKIILSVRDSVKTNEKRLYDVAVKLMVEDEESENKNKKTVVVRKRLRFEISGKLTLTGLPITLNPVLYISPFSLD